MITHKFQNMRVGFHCLGLLSLSGNELEYVEQLCIYEGLSHIKTHLIPWLREGKSGMQREYCLISNLGEPGLGARSPHSRSRFCSSQLARLALHRCSWCGHWSSLPTLLKVTTFANPQQEEKMDGTKGKSVLGVDLHGPLWPRP